MISNSKRRRQEKYIQTKRYYKANFEGSLKIDDKTYRAEIKESKFGDILFHIHLNPEEFLIFKRRMPNPNSESRMYHYWTIDEKNFGFRDYVSGIEAEKIEPIYKAVISAFRECHKTKKPVKLPEKVTERLKILMFKLQEEKGWHSPT